MKGRLFRRVTKDLEITSRTSTRLADGSGERPASTPGFSHSAGGEDPESISAMIGDRRTRARRGRRFGWASAMGTTWGARFLKATGTKLTRRLVRLV